MNFHYQIKGKRQGPIDAKDLSLLLLKRELPDSTLIFPEGKTGWISAKAFLESQGVKKPIAFAVRDAGLNDDEAPSSKAWWVVGIIGVLVAIIGGALIYSDRRGPSCEEYAALLQPQFEQVYNHDPGAIAAFSQTHIGSEFRGATIKRVDCITFDGKDYLGGDLRNLNEFKVHLIWRWEGPLVKDGYTEMIFIQDAQTGIIKRHQFLNSNATINLAQEMEKIDWKKVIIKYALGGFGS